MTLPGRDQHHEVVKAFWEALLIETLFGWVSESAAFEAALIEGEVASATTA
jgi:hypothetical protein